MTEINKPTSSLMLNNSLWHKTLFTEGLGLKTFLQNSKVCETLPTFKVHIADTRYNKEIH